MPVIPNLPAPPVPQCGEGPTDFSHFLKPIGPLRAVMVFVGFSDAPGVDDPEKVADHLLGQGELEALFRAQSFGNLSVDVTVMGKLGWRMMPRQSTEYGTMHSGGVFFDSADQHRKYLTDALTAFSPAEVPFTTFDMVYVVAPKEAAFANSPAFPATPGFGVKLGKKEVRFAVTLGKDSYKNSFINLVHETGHLFGLPDLYPAGDFSENSAGGCWGIMSDIFRATGFLGWHRHKNGWLDDGRKAYVRDTGTRRLTLTPFDAGFGTSMVAFPVDDATRPSKLFVMEVAQPSRGTDGTPNGQGVLLYTVDSAKMSGDSPVAILPRVDSGDNRRGKFPDAPFRPGDDSGVLSVDGGRATLAVTVLQATGDGGFEVDVAFTAP